MKIAIVGAGFTGLAAAHALSKEGHSVYIFEKAAQPGGLAIGFTQKIWEWTLEEHYHHWFVNDHAVLNLAKELSHPVLIKRPKTSVYLDDEILQLDSPAKLLTFSKLSYSERIRMASTLGFLKLNPYWKVLERFNAATLLPKFMGSRAYQLIWEPQFMNKFGSYYSDVSLAWFWARIAKRTTSLAYPEKGFLAFAQTLAHAVEKNNGTILYKTDINTLKAQANKVSLEYTQDGKNRAQEFDRAVVTLPTFAFTKIAPQLPKSYVSSLKTLKGLGAINVVLRLKKKFLTENTYWLSVCQKGAPVMAVVEHTNFMNPIHYHNEHLVYLGNYLPSDHRYFSASAPELLKEFDSFLQKLHPGYQKNLITAHVFKAPFAQPIIPINYSRMIPSHITPLPNVLLANMQQVYPWDRGTNYAVALGQKAARLITH